MSDEDKRRKKFTQTFVDKVSSPPKPGRVDYIDTILPGFNLRVSFTGLKSYSVVARLNGKQRRFAIGDVGLWPKVDEARDRAREMLREISRGIDPTAPPPVAPVETVRTVKEVMAEYIEEHAKSHALRTWEQTEARLNKHVIPRLGDHDIRKVTRSDVRDLIRDVKKAGLNGGANHVLGAMRQVFEWAVGEEYIDANPTDKVKTGVKPVKRSRYLSDLEVRWLLRALADGGLGVYQAAFVRVMLLTGQRRTEVAAAVWDEFDLAGMTWTIPVERSKNKREHIVPLAPQVVAILSALPRLNSNNYVFPGWRMKTTPVPLSNYGQIKDVIDVKLAEVVAADGVAPMAPWRFHDLRRTFITGVTKLKITSYIAGRCVNHTAKGVTDEVYNQYEYLDEKRDALERWANYVEALAGADVEPAAAAE